MQARFKEPREVAGIVFSQLFNPSPELLQPLTVTSWVLLLEAKLIIVHVHSTPSIRLLTGSQNNAAWSTRWPCEKSTRAEKSKRLPANSLSLFCRVHKMKPYSLCFVKMCLSLRQCKPLFFPYKQDTRAFWSYNKWAYIFKLQHSIELTVKSHNVSNQGYLSICGCYISVHFKF